MFYLDIDTRNSNHKPTRSGKKYNKLQEIVQFASGLIVITLQKISVIGFSFADS